MSKIVRIQGRQLVQEESAFDRRQIITVNTLTDAPQDNFITKVKLDLRCIGASRVMKGIAVKGGTLGSREPKLSLTGVISIIS